MNNYAFFLANFSVPLLGLLSEKNDFLLDFTSDVKSALGEIEEFIHDIYDGDFSGWEIRKKYYWSSHNIQINKKFGSIRHSYVFDGFYSKVIVPVKEDSTGEDEYMSSPDDDFGRFMIMNMDKLNPAYKETYMKKGIPFNHLGKTFVSLGQTVMALHCVWRSDA